MIYSSNKVALFVIVDSWVVVVVVNMVVVVWLCRWYFEPVVILFNLLIKMGETYKSKLNTVYEKIQPQMLQFW